METIGINTCIYLNIQEAQCGAGDMAWWVTETLAMQIKQSEFHPDNLHKDRKRELTS